MNLGGDARLFLEALLIGLAVAAPVGPMSLMCMERTLSRGQWAGLSFGLGVAAADASYAALAALGVSALAALLVAAGFWIKLAGGVLMIGFGLRIAFAAPGAAAAQRQAQGLMSGFLLAYGLTLANPPTIVFFAGVFAALGRDGGASNPYAFILGVLAGSALWWLILTTAIRFGRHYLSERLRAWINRAAGLAVIAFALWGMWRS